MTILLERPYVRVTHGANDSEFLIAGKSVASVRRALGTAFNVPNDAAALVNGVEVGSDFMLRPGDQLEFIRRWGQKSVGEMVWTGEEFCQFFKITSEDLASWMAQGLRVKRCLDGSFRITETAVDEFFRGKPVENRPLADVPKEVSTEEAAQILGLSKDTVLKFRSAGLLQFRNAAPPGSSRPIYRFPLESVMQLRTSYEADEPTPKMPKEPQRRATKGKRKYKYIDFD